MTTDNFPKLVRVVKLKTRKVKQYQTEQIKKKKKKPTSRHILFKLQKIKKGNSERDQRINYFKYRGLEITISSDFSSEIMQGTGRRTGWWSRRMQGLPPSMNTSKIHLHVENSH